MAKKITLRMPIDLDNGNATNWLVRVEESAEGVTRHVRRKGRPDGWVDTVYASFMTLPEVRRALEAHGYEVTFLDVWPTDVGTQAARWGPGKEGPYAPP